MRARTGVALGAGLLLAAGLALAGGAQPPQAPADAGTAAPQGLARATFAGGCFWCMEPPFDKVPGVVSTTSGYVGGRVDNPTYAQVSAGVTGHAEAVQVLYDPARVTYAQLLEVFWRNIDPLAKNRQFCDVGAQYRSGIFVHDAEQRRLAEASRQQLQASGTLPGPIVTEVTDAGTFWPAEEDHQDYYRKNPVRYAYYRWGCGRDRRLEQLWGKAAAEAKGPPAAP